MVLATGREIITGSVCGVKVQEVPDPLLRAVTCTFSRCSADATAGCARNLVAFPDATKRWWNATNDILMMGATRGYLGCVMIEELRSLK